jgi:hypothetical protein
MSHIITTDDRQIYDVSTVDGCYAYLCQQLGLSSRDLEKLAIIYNAAIDENKIDLWKLRLFAAKKLTEILKFTITVDDLDFFAFTEASGGTNPFGCGGTTISSVTIFAFQEHFNDSIIMFAGNRYKFIKVFRKSDRINFHGWSRYEI